MSKPRQSARPVLCAYLKFERRTMGASRQHSAVRQGERCANTAITTTKNAVIPRRRGHSSADAGRLAPMAMPTTRRTSPWAARQPTLPGARGAYAPGQCRYCSASRKN